MAESNPFGQVPLGQGGTGKAVILDNHDAAKFDQAIIAAKQKKEEEDKAALKDARKAFKLEDWTPTVDPWSKDFQVYAPQVNELAQRQTDITMEYFDLQNNTSISPEEFDKKSSEVMLKQRKWQQDKVKLNQNLYMSKAHEDISLKTGDEITRDNDTKYMKDASFYNKITFDTPPDWLLAEANGDQEQARNTWLYKYNGGSLIETKFDHPTFATKMKGLIATTPIISEYGSTRVDDGTVRINFKSKNKKFNEDIERGIIVTNLDNNIEGLKFLRDNRDLAPYIMEYAGVDSVDKIPLKGKGSVLEFMATQDEALDFMRTNYFLNDETSYTETGKDLTQGGYGSQKLTYDQMQSPTKGADVLSIFDYLPEELQDAIPTGVKEYFATEQEDIYWGYSLTPADFKNKEAAIPQGELSKFREAGTGKRFKFSGNVVTTNKGGIVCQPLLKKDVVVDGVKYYAGDYINDEIITKANLKIGDYQPISVNLVEVKEKVDGGITTISQLAQIDANQYHNNTAPTKRDALTNEQTFVLGELDSQTIVYDGQEYNAAEYLQAIVDANKGDWRKSYDDYSTVVRNEDITYK